MIGIRKSIPYLAGILLSISSAHAAIPPDERNALIELYHATEGENWTNKSGWLGEMGTECQWQGIRCSQDNTFVNRINLGFNNLKGTIPREIEQLSQLQSLRLSFNKLTGTIPKEIGNLSKLTSLTLGDNQLEAEIPKELGQLNLAILVLANNKLIGEIPVEIGQISTLNTLWLHGNQLTGSVFDKLPNIGQMKRIRVDHNCLDIDDELSQITTATSDVRGLDLGNQGKCIGKEDIPLIITGYSLDIEIPAILIGEDAYQVTLKLDPDYRMLSNEDFNNPSVWKWKVGAIEKTTTNLTDLPTNFDSESNKLTLHKIHYRSHILSVTLQAYQNPEDKGTFYFKLIP